MQFIYHKESGAPTIKIDNELYTYIFKIRRHDKDTNLFFRNLIDDILYEYTIEYIDKRSVLVSLRSHNLMPKKHTKNLHIGWCSIDPKNIEKMLPSLNELGVAKITFIGCDFSQKNQTLLFDRIYKLLQNSSSQCGRSDTITIKSCKNLQEFLQLHPESYLFHFSPLPIDDSIASIETIVLGCEGGLSDQEVLLFDKSKIVGMKENLILRSETAALTIAAKIL